MDSLKAQTVDPEVRAYVSSLVTAVGGQSTTSPRYEIGDSAVAVLNDILRWLRLYDDKTDRYDVKRCLADANFVKGDVLPILALWPEEEQDNKWKAKLALACLQLLVTLTWPMEVREEKTKVNHLRHMPVLQLAQVAYKREVLHSEEASMLRTVIRIGLPAMAVSRRDRSRREEGIIKLMLYCFQNIVMITQPGHLPSQGDENEVGRPATIQAFADQGVFDALLAIGSGANDEFQEHDVIMLSVLFHLVKGVDAKKLFVKEKQLAQEETNELQSLMKKEKALLNDSNKHAPTRHNRFGTMIWVKKDEHKVATVSGQSSITNASSTLQQMDASKKYNKPKYRGKQTIELNESEDFGGRVELTQLARKDLRRFVEDFLDSSFNPLFSSLRKAIEREDERVLPSHLRQFWYLISWFLDAESARCEQKRTTTANKAKEQVAAETEDNTFAYIAAVLDQETFVLLNRHMQRFYDEKSWQELRAALICFTSILLTVQNMSVSQDEEDQEIAENIQNRIFYEESTHDRIVQICRTYSNQGLGYLDAVTECVHVFVRMLEAYSKQNADLQIRSKRRARRKKRIEATQSTKDQETGNIESAADQIPDDAAAASEDEREVHLTTSERKFDFARFSAKFLSQGCVDTFVALTHFYLDLTPEQLKRCHRFFYRLAFKQELFVLLFRVDMLLLFQQMIKGPGGLDSSGEMFKEWSQLVQQVFRRCFKWLDRKSEGSSEEWKGAAVTEMLFSKIPATMFYLQNGYELVKERRAPRPPAELEVKPSVKSKETRVAVAVSLLLEKVMVDEMSFVRTEFTKAEMERSVWEFEHPATNSTEESQSIEARPSAPTISLSPGTDEIKQALFKNKFLRLLLTTLGAERLGADDDTDASWIIPSSMTAEDLKNCLRMIEKAENEPPIFDGGKNAMDLIRTKPTTSASSRGAATFSEADSDASDADLDNPLFPPNLRHASDNDGARPKKRRRLTKRNRTELTEEQAQAQAEARRTKEKERNLKIKSALFVTESDDESDAEADAEFFRLEEERRRKVRKEIGKVVKENAGLQAAERLLMGTQSDSDAGTKGRAGKKRRIQDVGGISDIEDRSSGESEAEVSEVRQKGVDAIGGSRGDNSRKRSGIDIFGEESDTSSEPFRMDEDERRRESGEGDAEDTPHTSQPTDDNVNTAVPLTEVSNNAVATKMVAPDPMDTDDDELPVNKGNRGVRRGRLIVVDDDEDDV